ncbi:MAG: hypothetical protein LQ343_004320 [Gyalolechia ehrenbergii]|nr:MAG: hypothetical protein LQ343_004320 [Gyalolechia ehrenbergii]
MDTFKLLSRSTKLHRSSPSKGVRVPTIPSAVNFGHVETGSRNDVHLDEIAGKSKKRKRSTTHSIRNLQASPTAQRGDTPIDVDTGQVSRFDDTFINTKTTISLQDEPLEVDTNADTLNRGEWRRVLKQNRVKVTLLADGSGDDDERKRKHTRLSRRAVDGKAHTKKVHPQLTLRPLRSFSVLGPEYNVSKRLSVNLDAQGYTIPTEVQLGAIPILLGSDSDRGLQLEDMKEHKACHRSDIDLLTVAPTGSGKTLAFLIHLLHGLREHHRRTETTRKPKIEGRLPKALILAPTPELVDQIVDEGRKLASGTGIRISRMRKGMKLGSDGMTGDKIGKEDTLEVPVHDSLHDDPRKSPIVTADILVSTPMLLLHATAPSPELSLAEIRYLVLDEADILLDPLFRHQTLDVWNSCNNVDLQTSLWSATIGSSVENLARYFILDRRRKLNLAVRDRKHHVVRLVVGLKDSAAPNVSHQLVYAATERGKLMALRQLIHPTATGTSNRPPLQPPFLVFTQTILRAVALHSELLYDVPVEAGGSSRIAVLHSELSDKTRSAIMAGFRKGEIWILVTTDLLARGVDFRGVNGVVNYDIPNTSGIYVHRVGRTGRQGREGGVAVTLYTKEDIEYVKNVANVIAASERQRGKVQNAGGGGELQKWLLSALPDVSKKSKKALKQTGVEARRTTMTGDDGGKTARRMRISTKSGYDRRLEHNRKGAGAANQRQPIEESPEEEWEGI